MSSESASASRTKLEPVPEAAAAARRLVRNALDRWGRTGAAESATLVVSEFATNAIRLGQVFEVAVAPAGERNAVLVLVWDGCPDPPVPRQAGDLDETGRGLGIVEAYATAWGWEPMPDGKVVWAVCGG